MDVLARNVVIAVALGSTVGCSFDWDGFDPRLDTSATATTAAAGGSGGGGGATGGNGGSGATGGSGGSGGMAPLGPWGTPTLVAELSDPNTDEDDPVFTADLLELYFNSNRLGNGDADIFIATRTSMNDPWGNIAPVTELNSGSTEGNQVIAPDGLTIWFERMGDIWVSTRLARNDAWSAPVIDAELSSTSSDLAGAVSDDGLMFMLSSGRGGGLGRTDIWVATRNDSGDPWDAPVHVPELSTVESEAQVWLHPDGLTIYFDSDRDAPATDGDIFTSTRPTRSSAWNPATAVTELNTVEVDSDVWISPDQRYLLLVRGNSPDRDIWESRR